MPIKYFNECLAELLGTLTLVFIGCFSVIVASSVLVPAFGHGLILVGIIFVYGSVSGAHVNPAVTLALLVAGKIEREKALYYMGAQFIGALLAGLLILILVPDKGAGFNYGATKGALTDDHLFRAVLMELLLTYLLVTTVMHAAVYGKAGNLAPLAIGFSLAACILAGGALTGASLNPARTLGPAVFDGELDYAIAYLIGIFAGGALAGFVNTRLFADTN